MVLDRKSEKMSFDIGGEHLTLFFDRFVFKPTLLTKLIAENIIINPGENVLDMGCGIGALGIFAAKKGAHVVSSDIMPDAVTYTILNAKENNAEIQVLKGDLFERVRGKFDCIINDVSGICEYASSVSPWYPHPVPTGGIDGCKYVLRMIKEAKNHLNETGRIYLPVSSLSDVKKIIEEAGQHFRTKLIFSKWIPFCKELEDNIEGLTNLKNSGIIDFIKRGSRHLWKMELYECGAM